jgi:hypothetical protein
MQRHPLRPTRESIFNKVKDSLTDDGYFIHPGEGDEDGRVGSHIEELIAWMLGELKSKPIDADAFKRSLIKI